MQTVQPPTSTQQSVAAPLGRYTLVTIVGSPTNLVLFYLFLGPLGRPAPIATLLAAAIVAPLTYVAYRRFVWRVESPASASEATKYWVMTAISVGFAMLVAQGLETTDASDLTAAAGILFAYTAIWILRFMFLDKALFPA
jgi:putative flippase GtrA